LVYTTGLGPVGQKPWRFESSQGHQWFILTRFNSFVDKSLNINIEYKKFEFGSRASKLFLLPNFFKKW